MNRRNFLKQASYGLVFSSFGAGFFKREYAEKVSYRSPALEISKMKRGEVSLIRGDSRRENLLEALDLMKDIIKKGIAEKTVVIKPNIVAARRQIAVTHVECLRAILDFLRPICDRQVIIAEDPAGETAFNAFKILGYFDGLKDYNIKFVDLGTDEYELFYVLDRNFHPIPVRVAKTILRSDIYLISAHLLKTHNWTVITHSLKNIVMGVIQKNADGNDKRKMHQEGYKGINYNLFHIGRRIHPHLSITDGFIGMEGRGPFMGDPVDSRIAMVSSDFMAADRVAVELMGHKFEDIGYLNYCAQADMGEADLRKINIRGNKIQECKKDYKPHPKYNEELQWK